MAKMIALTLLLLLFCGVSRPEYINYCYLSCGNIMHTLCNSQCGYDDCKPIEPDQEWRTRIVDYHNRLRNQVALGKVTAGGNGKAANMMALSYDMYLEYVSACWVYEAGKPIHDFCRKTKDFAIVGQNIWRGWENVNKPEGVDVFMQFWFGENVFTTEDLINAFKVLPSLLTYRYFTQLAWANTTHVGCGRCMSKKEKYTLVACNYGPGGNQEGYPVYIQGEPATRCPNGTKRNEEYPGLCGISTQPRGYKTAGLLENQQNYLNVANSLVSILLVPVYHIICGMLFFHAFALTYPC